MPARIKRDDQVVVIAGKDRGKRGKVLRVDPTTDKVIVEGLNMIKRHQKAQQTGPASQQQGGVIEREAAIHVSNVAILDPKSDKPTKVGFKFLEDGRKVRVTRGSGETLDR